jgi:hypothetical protein
MARYSLEEKEQVHSVFGTILDRLEQMNRQPDSWEESHLVHALSYMESGVYDRARLALSDCVTPQAERSTWRAAQLERNPRRYHVSRLRQRLEQVIIEARQR